MFFTDLLVIELRLWVKARIFYGLAVYFCRVSVIGVHQFALEVYRQRVKEGGHRIPL